MKGGYSVMRECMTKAIEGKNIKGCFPFPTSQSCAVLG